MSACIDHGQKAKGYAMTHRGGKRVGVHVAALMDATGEEPNGRFALHTCDNPRCRNAEHLYWGDHTKNMQDMVARDRWAGGRPQTISDAVRGAIRASKEQGNLIAARYGVSKSTVSRIRSAA